MKRPCVPPPAPVRAWRPAGPGRAIAFALLAAAGVCLSAPPLARAQSSADALVGCYAQTPGGALWFSIARQGGALVASWKKTGSRDALGPGTGEEEREAAAELGLGRFPGVTIVASQTDTGYRETIFVVLSSALSWDGQRTQFVMYDVDFGLAPLFRTNCQ